MSKIARTSYLAKVATREYNRIKPLIETYNKLKDLEEKIIKSIREEISEIESKIEIYKEKGIKKLSELTKRKDKLLNEIASITNGEYLQKIREGIVESLNKHAQEVDGVILEANIDNSNKLSISVEPDLFNTTTDYLKETLISPETYSVVEAPLVGTSPGGPVTVNSGAMFIKTN